jgi:hypothetical protein
MPIGSVSPRLSEEHALMAKRITINGRAETLLQRLIEQFRQDNTELEGTMSDGKAASLIVQALITWAYKDEIVFGMDPKGGLHIMIPKEKVEALQEVIILR